MKGLYKLFLLGFFGQMFLPQQSFAVGTEQDSLVKRIKATELRPASLDTLSLHTLKGCGIHTSDIPPKQLKESLKRIQDDLISAVNSLPDTLYKDVNVDTMSFRQLYEMADMDYPLNVDYDTYFKGVARFLKLLDLKNIEYKIWLPTLGGLHISNPFFLEYVPEEGEIAKSLKPGYLPPTNIALCPDYSEGLRKYAGIIGDLNGKYIKTPIAEVSSLQEQE